MKQIVIVFILSLAACHAKEDNKYYIGNDTIVHDKQTIPGAQPVVLPGHFGFGRTANRSEITAWDIDIRPDGKGLPAGEGTVSEGRSIFSIKCSSCHGNNGSGGSAARLTGAIGDTIKTKTIGNYWPYATTLFDYIRRTMPYSSPGSLENKEVYDLTAYLLYLNKIVDSSTVINNKSLPMIVMPAQRYFVKDDRRGGNEVR